MDIKKRRDIEKSILYVWENAENINKQEIYANIQALINRLQETNEQELSVINNNSQWKIWDLFHKTVNQLMDLSVDHKSKDRNIAYERALIRFIERLPSGDYSKIREEWNNQS